MSEEKLHELTRKVMEAIEPNQNLDFGEFTLRVKMVKPQQDLCDFVLKLFEGDTEKQKYIHEIKRFVNENDGYIVMSDFLLESDITNHAIGDLQATIDKLCNDDVDVVIDDNYEQVATTINYEYLSLDTLKKIYGVLEKHKKQ